MPRLWIKTLAYWSNVVALSGILWFISGLAYYNHHFGSRLDGVVLVGASCGLASGMIAVGMASVSLRRIRRGERGRVWALVGVLFGSLVTLYFGSAIVMGQYEYQDSHPPSREWMNMHQIGIAMIGYANADPDGRYPPDLPTLLRMGEVSADCFVSPSSDDTPAPGKGAAEQASHLLDGGHLTFIYVGAGLKVDWSTEKGEEDASDEVVMYEPLTVHRNDGSEMLFADGHVEYLKRGEAEPIIRLAESGIRPVHRYPVSVTRP